MSGKRHVCESASLSDVTFLPSMAITVSAWRRLRAAARLRAVIVLKARRRTTGRQTTEIRRRLSTSRGLWPLPTNRDKDLDLPARSRPDVSCRRRCRPDVRGHSPRAPNLRDAAVLPHSSDGHNRKNCSAWTHCRDRCSTFRAFLSEISLAEAYGRFHRCCLRRIKQETRCREGAVLRQNPDQRFDGGSRTPPEGCPTCLYSAFEVGDRSGLRPANTRSTKDRAAGIDDDAQP